MPRDIEELSAEGPLTGESCPDLKRSLTAEGERCWAGRPGDAILFRGFNRRSAMSDWQQGTVFHERYCIERKLGEGGMGVVYLATDQRLQRWIALKILPYTDRKSRVMRFRREAMAIARLSHPHIVVIYDFDTWQNQPYIAMEYLSGSDLSSVGRHELNRILASVLQVCVALEFAHSQGVIHRDIKPDNIRLLPDGAVKLVDFGLALFEEEDRLTEEGMIPGTAPYLAPEQLLGKRPTAKTDQYALGMVLYRLLSQNYPFRTDSELPSVHQRLYREPTPLREYRDDLPDPLLDAVTRALASDPEQRFPSMLAFASLLRLAFNDSARLPAAALAATHQLAGQPFELRRAADARPTRLSQASEPQTVTIDARARLNAGQTLELGEQSPPKTNRDE